MIKYTFPILASFALMGCPGDKSACDSSDTAACDTSGEGEGEGEGEGSDFGADADWSASGVTITITGGSGAYDLGMAETDAASSDPWTGEDCLNGYTTGSGTNYLFCHTLSSTGGALSSVTSIDDIVEGSTTIFSSSLSSVITYAIWDSNSNCYTWGHDTSYYTVGAGCSEI